MTSRTTSGTGVTVTAPEAGSTVSGTIDVTFVVSGKPVSGTFEVICEGSVVSSSPITDLTLNKATVNTSQLTPGAQCDFAVTMVDKKGKSTMSTTTVFISNASLVDFGNSSIDGSAGDVVADGSSTCTVTVTLNDASNQPVPDVVPTFSATDTDSKNTIGTCSASNASGISTCTLKSTRAEAKTLSIATPIQKAGGTCNFVAGAAAKLAWVTPPDSSVRAAEYFPLAVEITDNFDNRVTTDSGTEIGLSISNNSGASRLIFLDDQCNYASTGTVGASGGIVSDEGTWAGGGVYSSGGGSGSGGGGSGSGSGGGGGGSGSGGGGSIYCYRVFSEYFLNSASGLADTAPDLATLDKVGTGYTLKAQASGFTDLESNSFNVTHNVPYRLLAAGESVYDVDRFSYSAGLVNSAHSFDFVVYDRFNNIATSGNSTYRVPFVTNANTMYQTFPTGPITNGLFTVSLTPSASISNGGFFACADYTLDSDTGEACTWYYDHAGTIAGRPTPFAGLTATVHIAVPGSPQVGVDYVQIGWTNDSGTAGDLLTSGFYLNGSIATLGSEITCDKTINATNFPHLLSGVGYRLTHLNSSSPTIGAEIAALPSGTKFTLVMCRWDDSNNSYEYKMTLPATVELTMP